MDDIVLVQPQGSTRTPNRIDTMKARKISTTIDALSNLLDSAERIGQAAAAIQSAILDAQNTLEDEEVDPSAGLWDLIGSELGEIGSELAEVRGGELDARRTLGNL